MFEVLVIVVCCVSCLLCYVVFVCRLFVLTSLFLMSVGGVWCALFFLFVLLCHVVMVVRWLAVSLLMCVFAAVFV